MKRNFFVILTLFVCVFTVLGITAVYADSFSETLSKAEAGDPEAQNEIGLIYFYGKGVRKNYPEAVKWFDRAVKQDNYQAYYNLGVCYENGYGVEKDEYMAMDLYDTAYTKGKIYEAKKGFERIQSLRSGTIFVLPDLE